MPASFFMASFFLSFFIGFILFRLKDRFAFSELLPIFLVPLVGFITLFYVFPEQNDFVSDFKIYEPLTVFTLSAVVFFAAGQENRKLEWLALAMASVILACLPDKDFLLFKEYLPFWLDRASIAAIVFTLAGSYGFLNTVRGILPSQIISVCAGLFIIAIIGTGAIPLLLGAYALVIAGVFAAFLAFNLTRIDLNDRACSAIGLLIAWLLLKSSEERAAPCCLILLLPFIIDFLWALCQKINHLISGDSKPLYQYSAFSRLGALNIPAVSLCKNYVPINILMIIFAAMQTYAPNSYSFAGIGALFAAWYISKLETVQSPTEIDSEWSQEPEVKPEPAEKQEKPEKTPKAAKPAGKKTTKVAAAKKKPAAPKKAALKKKSPAKPSRKPAKRK